MRLQGMFIAGLGTYLPEPFSVAKAVELGLCDRMLAEELGWQSARIAGDMPAPEMAIRAASVALKRSGLTPQAFGLLIHTSASHQGPDSWSPQHYIQRHTIGGNGLAIHMREGCQGMLAAIDVAASYLMAAPERSAALITGADNLGHPLVDRWRCQPNTILADAAAAVVLSRNAGFARLLAVATTSVPEMEELMRGDDPLFPPSATVGTPASLTPRAMKLVGDVTFSEMFRIIQEGHEEVVERVLAEAGVNASDITKVCLSFAVSDKYIKEVIEPLGFDSSRTDWSIAYSRQIGHAASADPLLGLTHLVETGQVSSGDHILIMASSWMLARTCAVVKITGSIPPGS